jgi:hypothetical protein
MKLCRFEVVVVLVEFGFSVGAIVGNTVGAAVGDSVGAGVGAGVGACFTIIIGTVQESSPVTT